MLFLKKPLIPSSVAKDRITLKSKRETAMILFDTSIWYRKEKMCDKSCLLFLWKEEIGSAKTHFLSSYNTRQ